MHATENRTTLIYNDWGDHRVGADILCYMTGYEDPRLEKMFLPNDKGDYVGIRIGIDVTSKSQAQAKYSNMIVTSSTPYLWINAAEVAFLKAALGNEGCRQGALRAGDPPLVRGQGRQGRRRLYRRQDQKTCGL